MTTTRLPVCQLAWGVNNGVYGLMYPSELEYDSQDFTFMLPVPVGYVNQRPNYGRLINLLQKTEFYFPIEIAGRYIEIIGKVNIQDDIFYPNLNNTITFETPNGYTVDLYFDLFLLKALFRQKGVNRRSLYQYIGKYKKAIFDDCLFIPLWVKDPKVLNELFLKHRGIFVGYTNYFGVFGDGDNNFG